MMRAVRVATLVGAITMIIAIAGCGDDDASANAEPAGAQTEETEQSQKEPEESDEESGSGNREVAFEAVGAPVSTVLTGNCSPDDPADCIIPTNFSPTELTGDVRGTAFGSAVVIGRNGVYPGSSLVVFVGEVEGCGTGGLVVNTVGTFDASSGLTTGEWTVNEDGGTGELADVAGSGTSEYDATGGRYEGRIRCR